MKTEYVKLTAHDLNLLIDVCQMVVDYKYRSLTRTNWAEFELKYLPKLLTAIKDNQFKVVDSHNNILTWIIDNIAHSCKVVDGLPKKDWIPLVDLERVQECLGVLRRASRGQVSYNTSKLTNQYHNLFSQK
jgi:hypothetical protein